MRKGLRVERTGTPWTEAYGAGAEIDIPISHHDGNYTADADTLDRLEGEGRVAFRYLANPNGSANNIAGIINEAGNVLGMMPHPERCSEDLLGSRDGHLIWNSLLNSAQ